MFAFYAFGPFRKACQWQFGVGAAAASLLEKDRAPSRPEVDDRRGKERGIAGRQRDFHDSCLQMPKLRGDNLVAFFRIPPRLGQSP